MRYREITEGKVWENTPTITLYHGTSSVLLPALREHGLLPPAGNLADFVREVMTAIQSDENQWPDDDYFSYEATMRRLERNRSLSDRTPHGGRSLYFFTEDREETPSVRGYARAYAQHGGEMAYEIWKGMNGWRKDEGLPPLPPRWPHGKPVVLTIEVPREWCIWHHETDRLIAFVKKKWDEGHPRYTQDEDGQPYASVEDAYADAFRSREVRVPRAIPPTMIVAIREISP